MRRRGYCPHHVVIPFREADEMGPIYEWMEECVNNNDWFEQVVTKKLNPHSLLFAFDREKDALMFALKFGGKQ